MPPITLYFDVMPVTEHWQKVRIYEGATQVAEVAMPAMSVTFTATKAAHTWTARSFDGVDESLDSNTFTWTPPLPPGHLRK